MNAVKPIPLAVGTVAVVFAGLCSWLYWRASHTTPVPVESDKLSYQTISMQIGSLDYELQIADTPAKKSLGLGERGGLAEGKGMLFVYRDLESPKCFWMKDMSFAIDIIWLDADSRVSHIEHSLSPATYPQTFCPDGGGKYVIELPAGSAEAAKLRAGDQLEVAL